MERTFKVIPASVTPGEAVNPGYKAHNCSDKFFATCLSSTGEESNFIVMYDFKHQKWVSPQAGMKQVIEYYV